MFIAKNRLVSRFIEHRYDVKGAPTTLPLTADAGQTFQLLRYEISGAVLRNKVRRNDQTAAMSPNYRHADDWRPGAVTQQLSLKRLKQQTGSGPTDEL